MATRRFIHFRKVFFETFKYLGADKDSIKLIFDDVCKRYSAKGRHYHNIDHIINMVDHWEFMRGCKKMEKPFTVFLSIIFHDIIYNTNKNDNEERSADYFEKINKKYKIYNLPEFVCKSILSTKHHIKDVGRKEAYVKYLLDFDLSILGSSEEEYLQYAKNIRNEYKKIPDNLYVPGRIKVLESFLERDKIYLTPEFKKLEKIARKNITKEIETLKKQII